MAKKNLHTKRGLSSDQPASQQHPTAQPPPIVPMSTSSYPIIPQRPQPQPQQPSQSQVQPPPSSSSKRFSLGPPQAPSSAYEAFHSVPPALPSELVPPNELSYPDYYPDLFSPGGTPIAPSFHDSVFASRAPPPPPQPFDTRSASMGDIFNVMPSMSSSRLPSGFNAGHRYSTKTSMLDMDLPKSPTEHTNSNVFGAPMFLPPPPPSQQQQSSSSSTPTPTSIPTSSSQQLPHVSMSSTNSTNIANSFLSQHQHPTALQPLPPPSQQQQQQSHHHPHHQQQHQHPQQFSSPPPPTGLNSVLEEVYPLQLPDPENNNINHDLSSRLGGLTISTSSTLNNSNNNNGLASPGMTSPTGFRSFGSLGVNTNPADQNPPCNTLYVGNLPPNASEEELKNMFSSCIGYQRLSFRNKSNGPMCFVEFEDISCATQAMQDLYGNPLSNSVKGGIRLSFSKNPLVMYIPYPL
ncbi:hypothetical protein BDA99DRAFT_499636 [Phascolomyces articulosus]|uniref:RRM domain-containing protein n=1 Tax=Phascolomyces articulosus TaxID=60185 RepID=A0AAD5PJG7_9FUNG|nr:hypothetical protein BDA99DRAFT_499636 [Phascolomyces articulosus]